MLHRILEEDIDAIENEGAILCTRYTHNIYPDGINAIHHGDTIKRVDKKDWELFKVYRETKDGYYGMPVLGLGLVDCFILKTDSRKLSPEELVATNGQPVGLYGSHSGYFSGLSYDVSIENVVDKY